MIDDNPFYSFLLDYQLLYINETNKNKFISFSNNIMELIKKSYSQFFFYNFVDGIKKFKKNLIIIIIELILLFFYYLDIINLIMISRVISKKMEIIIKIVILTF